MTTSRFQQVHVSVFLLKYGPCETSADKLYLQVDNLREPNKVMHDSHPEATCRVVVDYMLVACQSKLLSSNKWSPPMAIRRQA